MKMYLHELINHLERLGISYDMIQKNDCYIVVTPYGGRILGVYSSSNTVNMVWVNPKLMDLDPDMFHSGEYFHIGGERIWLSPEAEFFLDNQSQYTIPSTLDPGNYRIDKNELSIRLELTGALKHRKQEKLISFELVRMITYISNPYEDIMKQQQLEIAYVGYQHEIIATFENNEHPLSAWSIMQVPDQGTAQVQTTPQSADPLDLFSPTSLDLINKTNTWFSIEMRSNESSKLSFHKNDVTGKIGYLFPIDNEHSGLILCDIEIDKSKLYLDYPWGNPLLNNQAIQIYHDDRAIGEFGELEYHTCSSDSINNKTTNKSNKYFYYGRSEDIESLIEYWRCHYY